MKKLITIVLSVLMVFGVMLPNTILAEEEENPEILNYDEIAELAQNLGYDIASILEASDEEPSLALVEEEENDEIIKISTNQVNDIEVLSRILPESLTIDLFDPLFLYFNVKKGVEINNVNWYLEAGTDDPHKLTGRLAHSNLLFIPSVAFKYYSSFVLEAEIEYTDHRNANKTGKAFTSTLITVNDDYETNGGQIVNFDQFTVFPGYTLNLEALGVGKGEISLNAAGDTVTLKNVDYTFDPDKLYIDRFFTMNNGVSYESYNNEFTDINVNLIGENKVIDLYHKMNSDNDGEVIGLVVAGEHIKEWNPKIHLNGPGSLETYGGEYSILAFGSLIIDTKVKLISSKYSADDPNTTPGRLGSGIYAVSVTLADDADVQMDIAGAGIDASLAKDPSVGNIDIQKGAKLDIKNTLHVRHPFSSAGLPNRIYGLIYTYKLNIDGADVNMDLIADKNIFRQYEEMQKYEDYHVPAYIAEGIYSKLKDDLTFTDMITNINDSNVRIKIDVSKDEEFELIRGYAIDVSNYIKGKPSQFSITNSNLDIDVGENGRISSAAGIIACDTDVENSNVDIKVNAYDNSFGLIARDHYNDPVSPVQTNIINSNINLDATKYESGHGKTYGALVDEVHFTYADKHKQFVANGEDGAIVSYLGAGKDERYNEKGYVPTKLLLSNKTEVLNKLPINVISLPKLINPNSVSAMVEQNKETKTIDGELNNDPIAIQDGPAVAFYHQIATIPDYEALEDSIEGSISNNYYYETVLNNGEMAKQVVIKKIDDKKPIPFEVPKTGVR